MIRVLCIDDEPDHAELLKLTLESVPRQTVEFHALEDSGEVIPFLKTHPIDLIFLDYCLGAKTGVEVLIDLRRRGVDLPVIMLTSQGDEYIAVEVTRAGADGYLVKSDLSPEILSDAIWQAREQTHRRQEEQELRSRVDRLESLSIALAESNTELAVGSRTDSLTQILCRGAWEEAATLEHDRFLRFRRPYAIAMIDIDHFKKFNDAAGHQAGDKCLHTVAQAIQGTCRTIDILGRYGGEEFVILMPETDLDGASTLAGRILEAMETNAQPHPGLAEGQCVTLSIGIAPSTDSLVESINRADQALYQAKANGRNQFIVAQDLDRVSAA